ncbi:hypothetical protein SDC9_180553 [bioreactor metagenome]|uniref:Uncharacterized protein n=1 Tax=bioreactor metagenome TaxID=1076179 RepID=A0A645H304_9ZZZZ
MEFASEPIVQKGFGFGQVETLTAGIGVERHVSGHGGVSGQIQTVFDFGAVPAFLLGFVVAVPCRPAVEKAFRDLPGLADLGKSLPDAEIVVARQQIVETGDSALGPAAGIKTDSVIAVWYDSSVQSPGRLVFAPVFAHRLYRRRLKRHGDRARTLKLVGD